jgi:hypothetical protein
MPGDEQTDPAKLLKGLRHTRRFEDKPVPLRVMDELLAAGREAGDVRLLVIDDLVTMQEITRLGSLAQSMAGAAAMVLVLRTRGDTADDARISSQVADAVMLTAHHHGLGAGNGWFGTAAAQARVRELAGIAPPSRVLVAIGVGYIDDDPSPPGSSLMRAQATLESLSSGRNDEHDPERS